MQSMMGRVAFYMLFCLAGAAAQNGSFRVQTKVVQVPVNVTGKDGQPVDGLAPRDFSVLDDGVPQKVTVDDFGTGLPRISLAIAIQTSGISTPALASIRHIAGMIQPLVIGGRGEAAVVAFDSRIQWLQDFTPDDDKIESAVKNLKPGSSGAARMLDAISEVADHMQQRKGRKVLLLISESRDRGSETKLPQAIEAVERHGIQVFAAHYSAYATSLIAKPKDLPETPSIETYSDDPEDPPNQPPGVDFVAMIAETARLGKANAVKALTLVTGGSDFPFTKERGIENAIKKLGLEVHSQYILSFPQPKNAAGLHRIDVSAPDHNDFLIRSRRTYWAD